MSRAGLLAVLVAVAVACTTGRPQAPTTTPTSNASPPPSGDLAARLERLEEFNKKHAEAIEFLQRVYDQQKQAADDAEANEPDPGAIFAVDITRPIAAGQSEGPANALVTIVEAWDFG